MIIGGSGSGKIKTLLNLINEQHGIDKMYLYARDLNQPKYKILIKKRKDAIITQSYFSVPKNVRLNSTHYLIMKINSKRELQNIDYQDFIKIYREYTKEPHNVLTIDATLPASDPFRFRKSLFNSL